ncbi:MAG: hypothetical protein ACR2RF_26285 [Geminicoccaceae bacterium]
MLNELQIQSMAESKMVESLSQYAHTTYFRAPGHDEPFCFQGMADDDEPYVIGLSLDGTRTVTCSPGTVTFTYMPL